MATLEMNTAVSEDLLDEVWLMMHMAAEMGTQPARRQSSYEEDKYVFEAEIEPEFIDDVIETDDPTVDKDEKERALINVADTLMQMGDELNKQQNKEEDVQRVSQEIADYIKTVMAPDIEQRLGPTTTRKKATSLLTETGVLGLVYTVFKQKVGAIVGGTQDLSHIALVTHITKGVASGLENSSSGTAGLLATVSTTFVKERFGDYLQKTSSLTHVVNKK